MPRERTHGEDPHGLVPDLVAVAVRAVQDVAPPTLGDARDVREPILETGGDKDPPGPRGPTGGRRDLERVIDPAAAAPLDRPARPPEGLALLAPKAYQLQRGGVA